MNFSRNICTDPEVHPQPETYWGHVNTIGSRACYDEGKRVAETMCYAYAKQVSWLVFLLYIHLKLFYNTALPIGKKKVEELKNTAVFY